MIDFFLFELSLIFVNFFVFKFVFLIVLFFVFFLWLFLCLRVKFWLILVDNKVNDLFFCFGVDLFGLDLKIGLVFLCGSDCKLMLIVLFCVFLFLIFLCFKE